MIGRSYPGHFSSHGMLSPSDLITEVYALMVKVRGGGQPPVGVKFAQSRLPDLLMML